MITRTILDRRRRSSVVVGRRRSSSVGIAQA